jgi:hypothetical protein
MKADFAKESLSGTTRVRTDAGANSFQEVSPTLAQACGRLQRAIADDIERAIWAEGQAPGPLARAHLWPPVDQRPRGLPGGQDVHPGEIPLPIQVIQRVGHGVDCQPHALADTAPVSAGTANIR